MAPVVIEVAAVVIAAIVAAAAVVVVHAHHHPSKKVQGRSNDANKTKQKRKVRFILPSQ